MFINNLNTPFSVETVVEVSAAVKWLDNIGFRDASDQVKYCPDVHLVDTNNGKMVVITASRLAVILPEGIMNRLPNTTAPFYRVPQELVFTPFTEVADNQTERFQLTEGLF